MTEEQHSATNQQAIVPFNVSHVKILKSGEDFPNREGIYNYYRNSEISIRQGVVFVSEEPQEVFIRSCDIPHVKHCPNLPDFLREALANYSGDLSDAAPGALDILSGLMIRRIYLPTDANEFMCLVKSVLSVIGGETYSYKNQAVFTVALGSLVLMGKNFMNLVVTTIPHVLVPGKVAFKELGLPESKDPCHTATVINIALMCILTMGKNTSAEGVREFQEKRFNAMIADISVGVAFQAALPLEFMNELSVGWSQFSGFVKSYIEQNLINTLPDASKLESGINTQAKLVLDHALMKSFQFASAYLSRFMMPPWVIVPEFYQELNTPFKDAYTKYCQTDARYRPYIRLLRSDGWELFEYKNYPLIQYATGCLMKFSPEAGESMKNYVVGVHRNANPALLYTVAKIAVQEADKVSIVMGGHTKEMIKGLHHEYKVIKPDLIFPQLPDDLAMTLPDTELTADQQRKVAALAASNKNKVVKQITY